MNHFEIVILSSIFFYDFSICVLCFVIAVSIEKAHEDRSAPNSAMGAGVMVEGETATTQTEAGVSDENRQGRKKGAQ